MRISRLLIAAVVLWHSAALAQTASESPSSTARAEASARFRRGVELFQEEAYRAALVEFQRAYETAPDYRLLYNVAQTKLQLQDYVGAAQDYERYLTEGGAAVPLERRTQVEEDLAALRERVARVSIAVNRAGAEVFLDDVRVGTAPIDGTIVANVGRHRVSARAPDGANDARVIDLAGGDVLEVSLVLAEPVARSEGGPAPERAWSRKRRAALGTWAAGGALAVGAVITGVMTKSAQSDLDKLLEKMDVNRAEVDDKRTSTKRLASTTDVLIGTAIASGVAGTLLWVYGGEEDPPSEKKPADITQVRWNVGLGSLGVTGRF
jgi:hypothetical protein